jgi:hypothetical protein
MKSDDVQSAKPVQPQKKTASKSLPKTRKLAIKPKYVLDLDTLANVDDNSPTTLSMVIQAQKEAEKTLAYLVSDSFQQILVSNQKSAAQLLANMPVIDTTSLFAGMQTDFSAIKLAQQSFLAEIPTIAQLNKQLLEAITPMFDLRLAASSMLTDFANSAVLKNFTLDVSSLLGSIHVSKTTEFAFTHATAVRNAHNELDVRTTAVQTSSNQFVVQERRAKIELLLGNSQEQGTRLLRIEHDVSDMKSLVSSLLQQGQQHLTVKDLKYNAEVFLLKITGKQDVRITAARERQLCSLLLTSIEAMTRKWDIEDMLEHIGEGYTVDMSEYGKWLNMFYMAARRLNATLLPMLGYELISVDRKNQELYVNPAFYHN